MSSPKNKPLELSKCYDLYVKDATDVKSLVAYSLYKKQKAEFIAGLVSEGRTHSSIKSAIKDFNQTNSNSSYIEGNMERATKLLSLYEATYFNDSSKNLIESLEKKIQSINDANKPKSLWRDIGVNLLSNLVWVIMIALLAVLYQIFASEDFRNTVLSKVGELIQKALSANDASSTNK